MLGGFLRGSVLGLVLVCAGPFPVRAGVDRPSQDWVTAVVSRITRADRERMGGAGSGGTVTIRVRVAADGTIADVGIDEGSGSQELDERAIRAVQAAGPFGPPPEKLLTLEGFTELSFPLQLGGKALR